MSYDERPRRNHPKGDKNGYTKNQPERTRREGRIGTKRSVGRGRDSAHGHMAGHPDHQRDSWRIERGRCHAAIVAFATLFKRRRYLERETPHGRGLVRRASKYLQTLLYRNSTLAWSTDRGLRVPQQYDSVERT